MQHLSSFDEFLLEEATPTAYDSTIIPALGKNIYQFLKNKGLKVKLDYQNQSLGQKGQAKHLGEKDYDYGVSSYPEYILVNKFSGGIDEDTKKELMSKFSNDDINVEQKSPEQMTFTLKEVDRERKAGRDRMKQIPNQPIGSYDMMTKANRTQREKGYSGVSKQYNKAIKPEDNIYKK